MEEVSEVKSDFECVFEDLGRTIQLFLSSPEIGLLLGLGARRERFLCFEFNDLLADPLVQLLHVVYRVVNREQEEEGLFGVPNCEVLLEERVYLLKLGAVLGYFEFNLFLEGGNILLLANLDFWLLLLYGKALMRLDDLRVRPLAFLEGVEMNVVLQFQPALG